MKTLKSQIWEVGKDGAINFTHDSSGVVEVTIANKSGSVVFSGEDAVEIKNIFKSTNFIFNQDNKTSF